MKHSNSEKHSEIVKLDDSSDDESVVEVAVPAKEPPPILDLSSDEEGEVFSMGNPANEDDDDIVVVYCDERASKMDGRRLNPRTDEGSNKKRKKKSKRAKSKRKSKAAPESVNPPSWTKEMSQFYNNSWGGEHFDAAVVQRSMSNTRSQWPVLFDDIAPPRNVKRNVRCNNCNTFGHGARMCPEPPKVDVCLFCGTTGHLNSKCPTPICLRCGQPSSSYNFGCRNCSALAYSLAYCNKCNSNGHLEFECPESWRRYHSTTTTEGMANLPETVYKPRDQQFCCNCAARGHLYEECRKSPLSGNWLKRPNNSHSECSKGSKRRKMDKKQWFRGKKDKFQRNSNNWNRY
ncbi:hypothetical protein C0J52_11941 [Blattella germanica]|nr:hypothetical protein C0J52_11941 [Blattella germanica]